MSKKVNTKATTATQVTESANIPAGETLRNLMEKYPNVSLRRIAALTAELSKSDPTGATKPVNYGVLLKKSKDPIIGQPYDPEATNWEAVETTLVNKGYDPATNFGFDWESLNETASRNSGATLSKNMEDFPVGCKVYLRRNNTTPYEVMYKTETHVVIQLEGSSEPLAWANNTFLLNGPVFEPRAIAAEAEAESNATAEVTDNE